MTQGTTRPARVGVPVIRWMIRRDLADVVAIAASDERTQAWTEKQLVTNLRQKRIIGMVVELDEQVVGFMLYELGERVFHLLVLGVRKDRRRRGIGSAMLTKLADKTKTKSNYRRTAVMVDVPETHLEVQQFLRAAGFKAVRVDRRAADTGEDVYVFKFDCMFAREDEI